MTKVAIIGFGGMGFIHYCSYKRIEDAQVIAIADVDYEAAKEKLDDDGINVYSSMEELLENESPDMVDICTPTYTHAYLSIKAMEKGVHVLCEKPMSLCEEECQQMIDASIRYNRTLMIAHVVRFGKENMYLKKVIDSGELGALKHLDMNRISYTPDWSWNDWMRDYEKSGGCLVDMSIHDFDLAQYMFGIPKKIGGVYHKMRDNNDFVTANLIYDGFDVTITGGWYSCEIPFRTGFLACFEKGYLEKVDDMLYMNGEIVEFDTIAEEVDAGINISSTEGYKEEIEYFINCINSGSEPTVVMPESSKISVAIARQISKEAILI